MTDTGGVLSHPAIIAREYRVPAVVATGNATALLHDDQIVTVDGTAGRIEGRAMTIRFRLEASSAIWRRCRLAMAWHPRSARLPAAFYPGSTAVGYASLNGPCWRDPPRRAETSPWVAHPSTRWFPAAAWRTAGQALTRLGR